MPLSRQQLPIPSTTRRTACMRRVAAWNRHADEFHQREREIDTPTGTKTEKGTSLY